MRTKTRGALHSSQWLKAMYASYELLRSLLAPTKVDDKTFEELSVILANHYSSPPSEEVQRYQFNLRMRAPGKSVETNVAELHRLAWFCNYGDSLKKMLRDCWVVGVYHERIQERLLTTYCTLEPMTHSA